MKFNNEKLYLLLIKLWEAQNSLNNKATIEELNNIQEEFNRQNREMEKLKFELEHPEFAPISPKEYGMNIYKHKHKKK